MFLFSWGKNKLLLLIVNKIFLANCSEKPISKVAIKRTAKVPRGAFAAWRWVASSRSSFLLSPQPRLPLSSSSVSFLWPFSLPAQTVYHRAPQPTLLAPLVQVWPGAAGQGDVHPGGSGPRCWRPRGCPACLGAKGGRRGGEGVVGSPEE